MTRFVQVAGAVCIAALGCVEQATAQPKGDRPVTIGFGGGASIGPSSGTYGIEIGYAVSDKITIFLEGGRIGNVVPGFVTDRASVISKALGGSAEVKDKATFGDIGVKYMLKKPWAAMYQPYVGVGVGVAKVEKESTFTIGGTSLNETQLLSQYGALLGSDLAGSTTKTTMAVLVGVTRSFGERIGVDVSYRYNRIFPKTDVITGDQGINAQRLQVGVFVRF